MHWASTLSSGRARLEPRAGISADLTAATDELDVGSWDSLERPVSTQHTHAIDVFTNQHARTQALTRARTHARTRAARDARKCAAQREVAAVRRAGGQAGGHGGGGLTTAARVAAQRQHPWYDVRASTRSRAAAHHLPSRTPGRPAAAAPTAAAAAAVAAAVRSLSYGSQLGTSHDRRTAPPEGGRGVALQWRQRCSRRSRRSRRSGRSGCSGCSGGAAGGGVGSPRQPWPQASRAHRAGRGHRRSDSRRV